MIRQMGKATWSVGACLAMTFVSNDGWADALPKGWQGHNVEPIGYVKLDGPRAFKLSIARRGERWYLFVGQGQGREGDGKPGFDVVDVSDPTSAASGDERSPSRGDGSDLATWEPARRWRANAVRPGGAGIEHRVSVQKHARRRNEHSQRSGM